MDRRDFLHSMGLAGAVAVASARGRVHASPVRKRAHPAGPRAPSTPKAWLFWDLWHLDRRQNLELCQGEPEWQPEATYLDDIDGLASWPTVYRDEPTGRWRMLYTSRWRPYTMMVAESDDGIHFAPLARNEIQPEGGKAAPHHIFTLPSGSCGGVYLDPVAADGYRFKLYGHQGGKPVLERARADPKHRWHEVAKRAGIKKYMHEEITLVSRDGLHWEIGREMCWGLPDWHPEPPVFGFYNADLGRHMMTVRPGWGDRRVCIQSTEDFRRWSGPQLLLQPDPTDEDLCELYGMPVFPYGRQYVGLLWVFHCEQAEPTRGFNRHVGPLDCQLAYSYDGVRFHRGLRRPFIPVNEPGQHGCGGIEASCLVETDGEIRIFSSGSKFPHGKNFPARRTGLKNFEAILVHTLRKDGFMYLASRGNWASFVTKPLALIDGRLTMNARAPFGEVAYQLTDLESKPLEGFTFDDCQPFSGDSLDVELRWGDKGADQLVGRIVRLEVRFREGRIYAFRGSFHFIDAQDRFLLEDGQKIDTSLFDF